MATFPLIYDTGEIPVSRIEDAICLKYNYQATVLNQGGQTVPNPETKSQFTKRMIGEIISNEVYIQEFRTGQVDLESNIAPITLE